MTQLCGPGYLPTAYNWEHFLTFSNFLQCYLYLKKDSIHLPMQGTQVQPLVQEDLTSQGATKPMCLNYWAHVPQLLSPRAATTEAPGHRPYAPQEEKPPSQQEIHTPQQSPPLAATREKPENSNKDPAQPKMSEWMNKIPFLWHNFTPNQWGGYYYSFFFFFFINKETEVHRG